MGGKFPVTNLTFFYLLCGDMMTTEPRPTMECNDAEWVSQSLAGSREAFSRIVEQYQSLICSLAYSATGNLSQSQDIGQETFLIAWKELRRLARAGKITLLALAASPVPSSAGPPDNKCANRPMPAESLEFAENVSAPGPIPSEGAIIREEEAILWRSLTGIPEIYREPLILFLSRGTIGRQCRRKVGAKRRTR